MDVGDAVDFVRTHSRAVLVTRRRDGGPQTSPVTVGVAGDGALVISTRETAMKVRNLERDPVATLCVLSDEFFGPWVQVEGPVQIVRLPQAMDGLIDYYRRLSGEHPDWDDYRAAMERERLVLLRLTVTAAGPDHAG